MRHQRRRLPAEWEPHAATWVAWPHNPQTWPDCLEAAEREFLTLVRALSEFEPVHVGVQSAEHACRVRKQLESPPSIWPIALHEIPTDDAWMRDIGPTFVQDSAAGLLALDWTFNSWGGKYPPWQRDDQAASRVAALAEVPSERQDLQIEGGALEVDGEGTLLATRSSMLGANRGSSLGRVDLERRLAELLGIQRFVWIDGCLQGDDTDGHIDTIARFVGPSRLVCARCSDPQHPDHAVLERCRRDLMAQRDARGRRLEVVDLPMPPPMEADGVSLPASYANFYIVNGALLVPVYDVPSDSEALQLLGRLFPRHALRPIPCRTLVRGLGAVHCLTQQQPLGSGNPLVSAVD